MRQGFTCSQNRGAFTRRNERELERKGRAGSSAPCSRLAFMYSACNIQIVGMGEHSGKENAQENTRRE